VSPFEEKEPEKSFIRNLSPEKNLFASRYTYPPTLGSLPPSTIASRLAQAVTAPSRAFRREGDLSLLAPQDPDWQHVLASRWLADVYLLALALTMVRGSSPSIARFPRLP